VICTAMKKTTFRLPDEANQYLERFSDERGLSLNAGLVRILKEHQSKQVDDPALHTAESLMQLLDARCGDTFSQIRLASSDTNTNVKILLEVLNSMVMSLRINHLFYSTRLVKSDTMKEAEAEVKKNAVQAEKGREGESCARG